jgi:hypothetical protein
VEPIRIAFVGLPRMMGEIIRDALADQTDLRVVAEYESAADLRAGANEIVDTLIAEKSTLTGDELRRTFAEYPAVKVLVIEDDGTGAYFYELHPRRTPLGELSPARLVAILRESSRGPS